MRTVICHFAGSILLYGPLNLKVSIPAHLINLRDKYFTNLVFLVRTVSYGSSFFPRWFMARALCAWAISEREKTWSITYITDLKLS